MSARTWILAVTVTIPVLPLSEIEAATFSKKSAFCARVALAELKFISPLLDFFPFFPPRYSPAVRPHDTPKRTFDGTV